MVPTLDDWLIIWEKVSFLVDAQPAAPAPVSHTPPAEPAPAPAQPAAELRRDLQAAFRLSTGEPAPIHDIYGTAEANWAAVQCVRGNYHIPPWVYAATLDDQDALQTQARSTGQFAFYDPLGGGDLFPAFFRTADEATLVRGDTCPCGGPGCYLEQGSIRDLSGEARCPRQE